MACVRKLQSSGLEVRSGFIVGFDHDSPEVFENQVNLIQNSRIVTAMVGLLNAPRGSRLYQRVVREGRLLREPSGDNTDFFTNLEPRMGLEALYQGYHRLIAGIYSPGPYYERVRAYLREFKTPKGKRLHFHPAYLRLHSGYSLAFFKSLFLLGVKDRARLHYWKLLLWSLFRHPGLLQHLLLGRHAGAPAADDGPGLGLTESSLHYCPSGAEQRLKPGRLPPGQPRAALGRPKPQLLAVNVGLGQLEDFPNAHAGSGHKFQHEAIAVALGLEDHLFHDVLPQDVPCPVHRRSELALERLGVAGVLDGVIEVVADEVEEGVYKGEASLLGGVGAPGRVLAQEALDVLGGDGGQVSVTEEL